MDKDLLIERTILAHHEAFGKWEEGDRVEMWKDENGNTCVRYESGKWWHYNEKGEWW